MAARILRTYTLDRELVAEIDRRAESGARSDLVNQLIAEALRARHQTRVAVAQGLVDAGVGTAALTALLVLVLLL